MEAIKEIWIVIPKSAGNIKDESLKSSFKDVKLIPKDATLRAKTNLMDYSQMEGMIPEIIQFIPSRAPHSKTTNNVAVFPFYLEEKSLYILCKRDWKIEVCNSIIVFVHDNYDTLKIKGDKGEKYSLITPKGVFTGESINNGISYKTKFAILLKERRDDLDDIEITLLVSEDVFSNNNLYATGRLTRGENGYKITTN